MARAARFGVTLPEIKRSCVSMVTLSALRGERMDELREALRLALAPAGRLEREQVWITSVRHKHCLEEARRHLGQAIVACERGLSEEFPLHDLRKVLVSVDRSFSAVLCPNR